MAELPQGWKRTDSGMADEWAHGELIVQIGRGALVVSAEGWHEDQEIPVEVVAEVLRSLGWRCAGPTEQQEPDLSGIARDLARHILDRPQGGAMPQTFESWAADLVTLAKDARELLGED